MLLDMLMSLRNGRSAMPPPEAGVRSSIVGIAAMKSIDENRLVLIEELLPIEYLSRAPDIPVTSDATSENMGYQSSMETS